MTWVRAGQPQTSVGTIHVAQVARLSRAEISAVVLLV